MTPRPGDVVLLIGGGANTERRNALVVAVHSSSRPPARAPALDVVYIDIAEDDEVMRNRVEHWTTLGGVLGDWVWSEQGEVVQ